MRSFVNGFTGMPQKDYADFKKFINKKIDLITSFNREWKDWCMIAKDW